MRRYLVTGGCGFIGSHLVDALLADGHAVRVLDNMSTGVRGRLDSRAELRIADLRTSGAVDAALDGVHGVFHLAAVSAVARCNEAWVESHRTNLTGTVRVFDAARRRRPRLPVVYASSAAVYGDRSGTLAETEPVAPLSPYGADKAACELHAAAAARVHGLPTTGLRFFNVYGPRQNPGDAYAGVISIFVEQIRRGRTITIFGDGEQTRDFVHVGDVVHALISAMAGLEAEPTPRAEICNVGTGRATTVRELAATLMTVLGRQVPLEHLAPRVGDIRHSLADTRRMTTLLDLKTTTTLAAGLAAFTAPITM